VKLKSEEGFSCHNLIDLSTEPEMMMELLTAVVGKNLTTVTLSV